MSFVPSSSNPTCPKELAAERRRIRVQKLKLLRLKNSSTLKPEDDQSVSDSKATSAIRNGSTSVGDNNTDERLRKKQNRMIRNRESAALSRQKKRDRISELEDQVKLLVEENRSLRRRLEKCEQVQRIGNNYSHGGADTGSSTPPLAVHVTYINGYQIDQSRSYLNQHSIGLNPGHILREPAVKIWPGDDLRDDDDMGSELLYEKIPTIVMDGGSQRNDSGGSTGIYMEATKEERDRTNGGQPDGVVHGVSDAEMYACLMDVLDDEP